MATHPLFRVRYWRTYPWPMQLLLLLLLVFTMASLFMAIAFVVVPALTGATLLQTMGVTKDSPRALINGALLMQALVGTIGMFLVPALLFAYLSTPRPGAYLGLRKPGKPVQGLLVLGCILGAAPVFLQLDALMRQILPPDSATQAANDRLLGAFLTTSTTPQLVVSLVVVALLPAVGEELFFRGVLFRFLAKKFPGVWPAVIGSALCFAVFHSNPSGMVAIFLAGMLFASFYYLTGSIWLGIAAHFVYNGSQAVLYNLAQHNPALRAVVESSSVPLVYVLSGMVLFGLSFWLLYRTRTLLPVGWASDADPVDPFPEG